MEPILIIVGLVIVVVVVVLVVRSVRSRSARSDWLGELSEIRRSSLGDDEEVTGALQAISVDDDPATSDDEPVDAVDPDGDSGGEPPDGPLLEPRSPVRTVTDAGTLFDEYEWPGTAQLRVDATDPRGLRVLADDRGRSCRVAVDLPRGVLWFGSEADPEVTVSCTVRVPGGWVVAEGRLLVLADEGGWSYAMCLDGRAAVRPDASETRTPMVPGQIARIRAGTSDHDVVAVGPDALESEGLVRRQRRLDSMTAAPVEGV